jgi:hypothetical protein
LSEYIVEVSALDVGSSSTKLLDSHDEEKVGCRVIPEFVRQRNDCIYD